MTLNGRVEGIIAAVKRTGKTFMIGHPTRYTPAFILARRMIQRGDIGELFMVESEYAHNYRHARGIDDWRVDPRRDPFLGGACHAMDLIRWITDDLVDEAFAYGTKKGLAMPRQRQLHAVFKSATRYRKVMCSRLPVPTHAKSVYGRGTASANNLSKTSNSASAVRKERVCTPFAKCGRSQHHNGKPNRSMGNPPEAENMRL